MEFYSETDPSILAMFPTLSHWFYAKEDELGSIHKVRFGRELTRAAKFESDTYMTADCLRQLADFMDSLD